MLDVRKFLAIPYKEKGRDYSGADCWGLPILFFREILHKELPDVNGDYASYFIENLHKHFERVEKPNLYDIVVFQVKRGIANHCGIVLDYGKFLHCCKDGTLVDNYNRPQWKQRFAGFYRLKNEQ